MMGEQWTGSGLTAVHVAASREELGLTAAREIAEELRVRLGRQRRVRMVFAAAPSQSEMLAALVRQSGIDWPRVEAFHMDEYLDLVEKAPQRFGLWLKRAIFDRIDFAAVHLIEPGADPDQAARNYARLLAEAPIDIVCLGVGMNGHLAFNDPPADLNDPQDVKVVELDALSRRQQVEDGCFQRVEDVPTRALTLTIPRLLRANRLFCCVPGPLKAEAVRHTLGDSIGSDWPSTALRLHPSCVLYLDRDSAAETIAR